MDNIDPALTSIIMPCHHAAPCLEDSSTDGSSEFLQCLAADHPERITMIYQHRADPFVASNQALARASGNCIAFLDADETWWPYPHANHARADKRKFTLPIESPEPMLAL